MAAASIPKFQTLITVQEFRDLVNKHFEQQIAGGELFNADDLKRFNEVDEYTLMFIQHGQFGTSFNQDRALRVFEGSLSWRKRHNVFDISTSEFPANFFDRRAIYFKYQDKYGHSILNFAVRKHVKGQDDNEQIKRFITYTFEQHVRDHTGQKIVLFFDMSNAGLGNLDYDLVKFFIASAQIFYPGLLAYMLMYKMSWILTAAWKLIRTWMEPEAEQFIKFVDAKSIQEYIAPDQLQQSMGGTAPDEP